MLTTRQHLLMKLAEECTEVGQRALKSMQFGAQEKQKGQHKTNAERLRDEIIDLEAVIYLLEQTDEVSPVSIDEAIAAQTAKIEKITKYRNYSRERGMVE